MRVTLKNNQPGQHPDGVTIRDAGIEPIMVTINGDELRALNEGAGTKPDAFHPDAIHTITIFPAAMSEEERSKFAEACAQAPVPNGAEDPPPDVSFRAKNPGE